MNSDNFDPLAGKSSEETSNRSSKKIVIRVGLGIVALAVLILIFQDSLFSNIGKGNVAVSASEQPLYVNRDSNFQMQYPKGWDINEGTIISKAGGNLDQFEGFSYVVVFVGPQVGEYKININVATENAQGNSLSEYVTVSKEQLAYVLAENNYRLLSESNLAISGHRAHSITYVGNVNGTQTKVTTVIIQDGANVFDISYTAPASVYDNYSQAAMTSISSIRFLN